MDSIFSEQMRNFRNFGNYPFMTYKPWALVICTAKLEFIMVSNFFVNSWNNCFVFIFRSVAPTIETFLQPLIEQMDPVNDIEKEYRLDNDPVSMDNLASQFGFFLSRFLCPFFYINIHVFIHIDVLLAILETHDSKASTFIPKTWPSESWVCH